MALDATAGHTVGFPRLSDRGGAIVTYLATSFLYGLGIFIGMVLLIVPGIMFAVAYFFYGYVLGEAESDPLSALRDARALSKGSRWPLFRAGLLAALIMLLGFLAFAVGVLLAIPVNALAAGHLYRQLRGQPVAMPGG